MKRRTIFTAAGSAAVAGLAVSGCGNGDSAGDADVLTVGQPDGPLTNNNNPFLESSAAAGMGYRWLVYEPLAQVNFIEPDSEPTPWLASEWEWSEDFTSLTLTIRSDVSFSDGTELTADDVAFTFALRKDVDGFNPDAIPYDTIDVDGDTVTITFGESQFINQGRILHTAIVPEHLWSDLEDPANETVEDPVGTGPYTLQNWTQQSITLVRNEDYWGGIPEVPEVRYVSYNDNSAQVTALANGDCQWSYVFTPDMEETFIRHDPDHHRMWFPSGLGIHALWINHLRAPFDNVALRQAMNLVIDREEVHIIGQAGLYPLVDSPTGIPTPAGDAFIAEQYAGEVQTVDVSAAEQILADAGFTLSDGVLSDPSGEPVTMELIAPAGWSDYLANLEIISDNLAAIGIDCTVESPTVDAWNAAVYEGEFDATMHWTNTGTTPWEIYANIMDGTQLRELGEAAAWNFGRYENDEATELLSDYASLVDEDERTAVLERLQEIMVEEVPAIPLVAGPIGAQYSTKHWVGWPSEDDPYAMPQPTQPSASQILMNLSRA